MDVRERYIEAVRKVCDEIDTYFRWEFKLGTGHEILEFYRIFDPFFVHEEPEADYSFEGGDPLSDRDQADIVEAYRDFRAEERD